MYSKRVKVAAIGIVSGLVIYLSLSVFGAIAAMEIPRVSLNDSPASVGLAYQDVSFTSRSDGIVLKGWYIVGDGRYAIIIVNGGYQNRVDRSVDTLSLTKGLVEHGYDLLLFDLRGRGDSGGEGLSLSHIEQDIGGAVDYLKGQGYSAETIGIIGFCSGAAAAAIFASQENIGALVLNGSFASVNNIITTEMVNKGIPKFVVELFFPGVLLMAELIYGYELVNPIDVIAEVNSPVLFIHEGSDKSVSLEETQQLLASAVNPSSELWQVSHAEHSRAYRSTPYAYIEKVSAFFVTEEDN